MSFCFSDLKQRFLCECLYHKNQNAIRVSVEVLFSCQIPLRFAVSICLTENSIVSQIPDFSLNIVRQMLTGNLAKFLPDYQTDTDSKISTGNL